MASDKMDGGSSPNDKIINGVSVCGSHATDIAKALESLESRFWNRVYSKEVFGGIKQKLSELSTIEDVVVMIVENILLREDTFTAQMRNVRLRDAIELFGMNDASMEVNLKGIITEVNDKFLELSGYSREELIGQSTRILNSKVHPKEFWKKFWDTIKSGAIFEGDVCNRTKEGDLFWLHTIVRPVLENGKVVSYQVVRQDVTEREKLKRHNDDLIHQKIHPLTGLPSRSKLIEDLSVPANRTLVVLHLNRMSEINSGFGHEAGDSALVQISNFLKSLCTESHCSLYKLEGADFAIVIQWIYDHEIISQLKQKLSGFEAKCDDGKIPLSFSAGMVVDGPLGHETVVRAYLALHQSKGHGDFVTFDHALATTADFREGLEMESLVKNAFEEDLFIPYFQKIHDNREEKNFVAYPSFAVENNTGKPFAAKPEKYECLVRMYDSSEKITLISPGRFLPAAKKSRKLRMLTRLMIDKTFDYMKDKNSVFSINLTGDDLSHVDFVQYVLEKSSQYGIHSDRVIFEILEEIESISSDQMGLVIRDLKNHGFRIAIDDFGTQYSNFDRMLDLMPDFLKIDMKYIRGIDQSSRNQTFVRNMVHLAHESKILVVAEGVETAEEQNILCQLSVDFSQGYYYSSPRPHL